MTTEIDAHKAIEAVHNVTENVHENAENVQKAVKAVHKAIQVINEVLQECVKKLVPVIEKIAQIYELSVPARKDNTRRKFAAIACKGDRHGKELQEKVHTNRRSWDYRPDKRRIHKASGIRKIR